MGRRHARWAERALVDDRFGAFNLAARGLPIRMPGMIDPSRPTSGLGRERPIAEFAEPALSFARAPCTGHEEAQAVFGSGGCSGNLPLGIAVVRAGSALSSPISWFPAAAVLTAYAAWNDKSISADWLSENLPQRSSLNEAGQPQRLVVERGSRAALERPVSSPDQTVGELRRRVPPRVQCLLEGRFVLEQQLGGIKQA